MFLKGEFRRADGLVIPNNVTLAGAGRLLELALRGADATATAFFVGLCSGVYDPDMVVGDLTEPTIGVNGYERIELTRSEADWPETGTTNGERWFDSKELVWAASGGAFSEAISRMFICFELSGSDGAVMALSASLPAEFVIDEDTSVDNRTFKYRIYVR